MPRNMVYRAEEAGRILRYRHLEETAEKYQLREDRCRTS